MEVMRLPSALLLAALVLAAPVPVAAAARPAPASVTVRGDAPFGSCPAAHARWSVTVTPSVGGRAVLVRAAVRDTGPAPCRYDGPPPGNRDEPAWLGPCGVAPLVVRAPGGHEVWPGDAPYNCPLLVGDSLAPGATLHAGGQWAGARGPGTWPPGGRWPAGRYQVVVAGRIVVPFTRA